ncbi:MAG: hypothetical protein K2J80_05185 [Oscillospiraceae bacterium]|nr:hypothetical protein [Oscillospiraceae bacterium]
MRKDTIINWVFVLLLILFSFVLTIIPYNIRSFVMCALLIFLAAVSVIKLIRAVRFQRAVKSGQTVRVTGTVTFKFGFKGRRPDSCTHAWARYSLNGKKIVGVMICSVDQRLQIDQSMDIIVPKSGLKVFAFNEKQVRDAVLTYAVLSAVAAAVTAVIGVCFALTR